MKGYSLAMRIVTIPCLRDNYAYLLIDESDGRAAVVDPSEVDPVVSAVEQEGAKLRELWLTHHHWDHVGGVEGLVRHCDIEHVRGSRYDAEHGRIAHQSVVLCDGDEFDFGGSTVRVLEIPGHTLGAIAFVVDGNLFSGDTLFLAGCGRVFEGTMKMMSESLTKLRELPPETRLWCGHEYTVNNLRFAKTVEPGNADVLAALAEAIQVIGSGGFTVPGSLEREMQTNPFLRFDQPAVAQGRDPVNVFSEIRKAKDAF